MKKVLVLGGTSFIGRAFCESILQNNQVHLTLFNRGKTNPSLFPGVARLIADRNNREQCREQLQGTTWDCIVDFLGYEDKHIRNVLDHCSCQHYTFISSSVVDLSFPDDPLFSMAKDKLWCECLIKRYMNRVLIVRPGFVCGSNDYTNRFEERDGVWYWKNLDRPVFPMIRVEKLANLLTRLVSRNHVGVARAGYHLIQSPKD